MFQYARPPAPLVCAAPALVLRSVEVAVHGLTGRTPSPKTAPAPRPQNAQRKWPLPRYSPKEQRPDDVQEGADPRPSLPPCPSEHLYEGRFVTARAAPIGRTGLD